MVIAGDRYCATPLVTKLQPSQWIWFSF